MWPWPEPNPEPTRGNWFRRTTKRCIDVDRHWAIELHAITKRPMAMFAMRRISWLGGGPLWYLVMLTLPVLYGWQGWPCTLQMLSAGAINLGIYLCVKLGTGRQRPYVNCPDIHACAKTLDHFSFPSGHTLHAASYAMIISSHYPAWTIALWAFAMAVAVSRITLGLHYPSDVIAGGIIGAIVAAIVLAWP